MSPTLTVGSFSRRVRSTFLFICSTTTTTTTRTTDVQNTLETSETHPKQKNDVQNFENILKILCLSWCFPLDFFGTMRLSSKSLGLHQRVTPSILQQNLVKNPKAPPFRFFGTLNFPSILTDIDKKKIVRDNYMTIMFK